jgi:hypothetical protein
MVTATAATKPAITIGNETQIGQSMIMTPASG